MKLDDFDGRLPNGTTNSEGRSHAERLHNLFRGADHRHGLYRVLRVIDGKAEIKDENGNGPADMKGPPTVALWEMHLASNIRQLGVSPVRADGMARWGVLDVDDKGVEFEDVVAEIDRLRLPVLACRSKSGRGGHCYLFATDWIPQADMNAALKAMAARLPFKSIDIFPPASSPGNWVCMPYGEGEKTDRYAAKTGGLGMTVVEFLAVAEKARQSPEAIAALTRTPAGDRDVEHSDNAHRAARKLKDFVAEITTTPEGGRANLLYGRAKDMGRMVGAGWTDQNVVIGELTSAALACGLSAGEAVGHILRGIEDGKKEPPDDGDGGGRYPDIIKIVVLTGGEEEVWRVTVADHGEITLPVKEVANYYTFNLRCAEKLRKYFRHMKIDAWNDRIDAALLRAEFEAIPPDETVDGMMREQLRAFCMDRHRGDGIDEILLGKPVHVDDEDRIYFRFEDFEKFLRTGSSRFKNETRQRLGTLIREAVGKDNYRQTMKVVKGQPKGMPVRWIRRSVFDQSVALPLPPIDPPPL
ncbi:UNVERIFIED_ORG: hypothetical protein GGI65_001965 [Rhizobium esperanzae]|nr:hypothetical protein RHECNPAF_310012 [Rhizobium etli CNPAF512]